MVSQKYAEAPHVLQIRKHGRMGAGRGGSLMGLYGLASLAKPKKKLDGLTISSLDDSARRSGSHIVLTHNVFVTRGRVEDLTLSRW